MSGRLVLVGTPIGNLSDVSPRVIEALSGCDIVAAEDSRVTRKLLTHFGIQKPLVSYFEHNKRERGTQLVGRMQEGKAVALVTDAGLPAISDPGEDLVALCHAAGIPVGIVPGPCAAVTALAASGLPSGRFTFEGFLSVNKNSRLSHLKQLCGETRTMIFYEAPHKLAATLNDLLAAFGDRRLAIARELTKLHEEIVQTTLKEAVKRYEVQPPRGEFVLVVEGAAEEEGDKPSMETALTLARGYRDQGQPASAAARQAARETGQKRGDIYRLLTEEEKG